MSTPLLQTQIVNFRKMKHDFASQILRDGKDLYEKKGLKTVTLVEFGTKSLKVRAEVAGVWANAYACTIEIDRLESEIVDSHCACPDHYDCIHLACLIFHLEEHLETLLVDHFQEKKADKRGSNPEGEQIEKVLKAAEKKVLVRKEKELEKELLEEYVNAASLLGRSSFFVPEIELKKEQGEIFFVFVSSTHPLRTVEVQLALKLPFRAKPLFIQQPKQFFSSLQGQEPFVVGPSRYVFGFDSFGPFAEELLKALKVNLHFQEKQDKGTKATAILDREGLGEVLGCAYESAKNMPQKHFSEGKNAFCIPGIFWESFEKPLYFFIDSTDVCFALKYIKEPLPKLLLLPHLILGSKKEVRVCDVSLLECTKPGLIHEGVYHRFSATIKREHLFEMEAIQKTTIPEQLFGSFVENALPELLRFAKIENKKILDQISTIPHQGPVRAKCDLHYSAGELEAVIEFIYSNGTFPENTQTLKMEQVQSFITKQGIVARNIIEENTLIRELFKGFTKDEKSGNYVANTERKIVEFMTEIVPRFQDKVAFSYPETLQNRFSFDDTTYILSLKESKNFGTLQATFTVNGGLRGVSVDMLWDCVNQRKPFVVLSKKQIKGEVSNEECLSNKILVIQLEPMASLLQLFDELYIKKLENATFELPFWVLVNLIPDRFVGLPVQINLTDQLEEIQRQIFSDSIPAPTICSSIQAELRHYQKDGIGWLARLRSMGLNGILADDMGLGKTLQAICAIWQYSSGRQKSLPHQSLIVCPTSLVDNWKEEFNQFQPKLKVATVTGSPQERKKVLSNSKIDVFITSYGLVQKDIELYESLSFGYLILDEAQHIKNRETRNARSVKKIPSRHKLILTGTPLENSLEDLWSLFDFLMPGLIGSYERFVNNYIRPQGGTAQAALTLLKKKITPFVLRRMKQDVLKDLPPISHIVYHCHLSPVQQELYYSYAKTAKENLIKLVEKEGFDKVRIHVLATLTRLKQICCHPAIFAKEEPEPQDSAKYEMLLDLLGGLAESKRKTVIFSQYTQMLSIMREDLRKMGTQFAYLDGSSKNRLSIVKQFNEDPNIVVFLVSLKAGGAGLNLVGADTVIHYDMWWNPAVENQATGRVWRLGQKTAVSSYKLITLGTIEEKILELQERKKNLLNDIVQTDEEVISKLTWEEVLELLKT